MSQSMYELVRTGESMPEGFSVLFPPQFDVFSAARKADNHDRLVEALEFIVNDTPEPGEDAQLTVEGYNKACAALAAARGETDA